MASFDHYTDIFPTGSSNGNAITITGVSSGGANVIHTIGASEMHKLWIVANNGGATNGVIGLLINGVEIRRDVPANDSRNLLPPDQILRFGCTLSAYSVSGESNFSLNVRVKGFTTLSTINS
jgi:hypothetical protein